METKCKNKKWEKGKIKEKEAPQVLFIDRCLDFVREGGRLAIVLPDGMLSNPTDGYIVQHMLSRAELIGLIDLPMSTFLPYTPTKTHLIFLRRTDSPRKDYSFFMSYAKTCGHDKRGREIYEDEISLIPEYVKDIDEHGTHSHLGWEMKISNLINNILLPKYYNPDIDNELKCYEKSGKYTIKSIDELQKKKIIKVSRGNEVGSENMVLEIFLLSGHPKFQIGKLQQIVHIVFPMIYTKISKISKI